MMIVSPPRPSAPTVIVAGVIANKLHNGGAVWTRLNWILGFRKLGFNVQFIEQIFPRSCTDSAGNETSFDRCVQRDWFEKITREFDLADSSTLMLCDGDNVHRTFGKSLADLQRIADEAILLVNISGHLKIPDLMRRIATKAFIDLDPGFTQFWHAQGNANSHVEGHDFYYSVGLNLGASDCTIPVGSIHWRPVLQPVVLDLWPVVSPKRDKSAPFRFTTIASWRGPFGPVQHEGKSLGLKVHQFRQFIKMPQMCPDQRFEIALDIHSADDKDRVLLRDNGWIIVDPKIVAGDPRAFRNYVQHSDGEFSVAQDIYVSTRSGWFSDRTVRYLASGRPALVQETGFSEILPTGEGLLAFATPADAATSANEIAANPERHGKAARAIAERYFDSDKVLGQLLREMNLPTRD